LQLPAVHDVQIEIAVVVEVGEDGVASEAGGTEAGASCDVDEAAVAVLVEPVAQVARAALHDEWPHQLEPLGADRSADGARVEESDAGERERSVGVTPEKDPAIDTAIELRCAGQPGIVHAGLPRHAGGRHALRTEREPLGAPLVRRGRIAVHEVDTERAGGPEANRVTPVSA